ncbi:MAG: serine protease [Candidatus Gracilibacteria bacterium]|nr:serine protease [Candidatus Gracilibacteria bacterium]
MKKIILSLLILFFPFVTFAEDVNINKIFKLESYDLEELTNSYILTQYGSAVYLDDNLIYTNAHVVLDDEDKPLGNYRVCKTTDFKEVPKCFSLGELLYYDKKNDLAVLKISNPGVSSVGKSTKELGVGDIVKVYGYPLNGGETISYTEGKISGYENGLYKIDANIDAGNSGGGVFDSEGKFVGIAVSVKVGYTTMGYVIPLSKVEDFIKKSDKVNIEDYSEELSSKFSSYVSVINKVIGSNVTFSNEEISVNRLFKYYGFNIDEYHIDNNNKYYYLYLTDKEKETYIFVNNGKETGLASSTLNDKLAKAKISLEESLDNNSIVAYKAGIIKFKGKNTLLTFAKGKDGDVALALLVEVTKNNYQTMLVASDNMKNKSFVNGLRVILKLIDFKDINVTDNQDYIKMDNLKIGKQDGFYVSSGFGGDLLKSIGDEIKVEKSSTIESKIEYYKDYTLSSYVKELYNYSKDHIYYNFYGVKETTSGDKYIYMFYKNNQYVGEEEDKKEKKYAINAYFFDKKDDETFYITTFTFTFDNVESKKKIDDLLNKISTTKQGNLFELGDIKVGENLIKEEGFDFR